MIRRKWSDQTSVALLKIAAEGSQRQAVMLSISLALFFSVRSNWNGSGREYVVSWPFLGSCTGGHVST